MYRYTIQLTDFDLAKLMMVLGYKSGTAAKDDDPMMFRMCLEITNIIGGQVPNFTPYEIPDRPEDRI